jgi:hypothetical protein
MIFTSLSPCGRITAMSAYRCLVCGVCSLLLVLAVGGCGGSSHHAAGSSESAVTSPTEPVSEPNAVVVRVGEQAITKAEFANQFATEVRAEGGGVAPVPPDFSACITYLRGVFARQGSKPTTAVIKEECEKQRQMFVRQALGHLIAQKWIMEWASAVGVTVSPEQVAKEVQKATSKQTPAQVAQNLAEAGRTFADFVLETKIQALAEKIRGVLRNRTEHPTQAQIARYYAENKALFGVPKLLDLEIARAGTEAEALKVKREIASGKSFASVVKKLPLEQPIFSKEGLVMGYKRGAYHQIPLNNAFFAAKPNVLSGPVKIEMGYYDFEVKRIHPAQQKTLAEAKPAIEHELPEKLYKHALFTFIKEMRARSRSRTNCRTGYVVQLCSQFKASKATPLEPEDPYTMG